MYWNVIHVELCHPMRCAMKMNGKGAFFINSLHPVLFLFHNEKLLLRYIRIAYEEPSE
ncbi:hypothetical protein [Ferroplasma sp.]|uniref:hypothetical protein n=1 Tax=Ferroplasma sp. TaxID=2591003 RepID=UPI0026061685|nr:hypothetical protein [Ferroplasma sp.]